MRLSGISSEEHFVPESLAPLHFDLERHCRGLGTLFLLFSTAFQRVRVGLSVFYFVLRTSGSAFPFGMQVAPPHFPSYHGREGLTVYLSFDCLLRHDSGRPSWAE